MACALIGRLIVVYIAKLIDESDFPMRYTDTDYDVFSDAATHVYNGDSPFKRHTYRYTPLAAYICLVNNIFHPLAGKIVFVLIDLAMCQMLWSLVESQNKNKTNISYYVAFWAFNPAVVAMSTRGSNDNIITALVFVTMYFLVNKCYVTSAFFYGLSVHFKIYPIIYALPLYLYIDCDKRAIRSNEPLIQTIFKNFFTKNRLVFTFVSAGTFIGLTYFFYLLYGYEFLYEGYLYHLVRKDNRHNVSVYWYMIYQLYDESTSTLLGLATFIPQWSVIIFAGLAFYHDLFFAMILQTWAFVAFNKVLTAQYFLWYLSLLPLVAINNGLVHKRPWLGATLYLVQLAAMPVWGIFAFDVEFNGVNAFSQVHTCNYLIFIGNLISIGLVIRNHRVSITK